MIRRCQIPIVTLFRVLLPNCGRSPAPLEAVQSEAWVRVTTKAPTGLIEWFYGRFTHGPADGWTRLRVAMAGGRTALTALFYGGTAATHCSEMPTYDTGGRFWMPIRPKNGVFYDENLAFNI